ncbi:MAG: AAA family ATPase [Pyrinomonadaceae bacterium]
MFLKKLVVHNYKSLRHITFCPSPLAVLIGPNASGKSNFADSIHFLSEVYSQGLEVAIARKGGYENIAFRKQRRSKAPINFEIVLESSGSERKIRQSLFLRELRTLREFNFRFEHRFSIMAVGSDIKAAFKVKEEVLRICIATESNANDSSFTEQVKISRSANGKIKVDVDKGSLLYKMFNHLEKRYEDFTSTENFILGEQDLMINNLLFRNSLISAFTSAISSFEVYQLSTNLSRAPGVPTPNPKLATTGENLPALVDWLQRAHPKEWEIVMSGMRDILVGLTDISVEYLHTKTLGVFFREEGVGNTWSADDVSDGTIHSLALLVASVDPRSALLVVEEPENSVHPWIIRVIMERLRKVSVLKNVVVTSHSPVLINLLKPEEVWIIFRDKGETKLQRLVDLDPSVKESWENGDYRLSEFLDSGSISQAVPGGVF